MTTEPARVSRNQVLQNRHAITFGGALRLHTLQPFNTIANELPSEPEMLTGQGKARFVGTDFLFGAGSSKPAIPERLHLIVHLNAEAKDEVPRDMEKFLRQSFKDAQVRVISNSIHPEWYSGELYYNITFTVPLNQRAFEASEMIIRELRPSR